MRTVSRCQQYRGDVTLSVSVVSTITRQASPASGTTHSYACARVEGRVSAKRTNKSLMLINNYITPVLDIRQNFSVWLVSAIHSTTQDLETDRQSTTQYNSATQYRVQQSTQYLETGGVLKACLYIHTASLPNSPSSVGQTGKVRHSTTVQHSTGYSRKHST